MSGDKDVKSDQTCCLVENGERCRKHSGNASFNFRVQKLVEQRKLKFTLDSAVSHFSCVYSYLSIFTYANHSNNLLRC